MNANHSLALRDPPSAVKTNPTEFKGWGSNYRGQLGLLAPSSLRAAQPVFGSALSLVTSPSPYVVQVSAGGTHSCVLLSSGEIVCAGDNVVGQLGAFAMVPTGFAPSSGTRANVLNQPTFAPLSSSAANGPPLAIVMVTAGGSHSCAVNKNGEVFCWGAGTSGRLGVPSQIPSPPVRVAGPKGSREPRFAFISAGKSHTCTVDDAGLVYCWGGNTSRQTNPASISNEENYPVQLEALERRRMFARSVSAGAKYTCAVLRDDTLSCWGAAGLRPTSSVALEPTSAPTLHHVWFPNANGQGVDNSVRFADVAVGTSHACAVTTSGKVACWGETATEALLGGQVVGKNCGNNHPRYVLYKDAKDEEHELDRIYQVSAGEFHTCALRAPPDKDGRAQAHQAWCWGDNSDGQLGTGSRPPTAYAEHVYGF